MKENAKPVALRQKQEIGDMITDRTIRLSAMIKDRQSADVGVGIKDCHKEFAEGTVDLLRRMRGGLDSIIENMEQKIPLLESKTVSRQRKIEALDDIQSICNGAKELGLNTIGSQLVTYTQNFKRTLQKNGEIQVDQEETFVLGLKGWLNVIDQEVKKADGIKVKNTEVMIFDYRDMRED